MPFARHVARTARASGARRADRLAVLAAANRAQRAPKLPRGCGTAANRQCAAVGLSRGPGDHTTMCRLGDCCGRAVRGTHIHPSLRQQFPFRSLSTARHVFRYFKDDVPSLFATLAALAARTTLVAVMHREGYGEVFAQAAAARGWECTSAGPEYCGPLAGGGGHCSLLLLT